MEGSEAQIQHVGCTKPGLLGIVECHTPILGEILGFGFAVLCLGFRFQLSVLGFGYWGYIRGYIGIMEKKMETTVR